MSYSLIKETWPVARKRHKCIWCGESILPSEKHRHEISNYCGELQDHRWHAECDEAAGEHFSNGEEEFAPYDNDRPDTKEAQ